MKTKEGLLTQHTYLNEQRCGSGMAMGHQPETNQCCPYLHLNQPHSKATSLGLQVSNPYQQARGRSNTLFLFIFL